MEGQVASHQKRCRDHQHGIPPAGLCPDLNPDERVWSHRKRTYVEPAGFEPRVPYRHGPALGSRTGMGSGLPSEPGT